jgi:hypothetical protein
LDALIFSDDLGRAINSDFNLWLSGESQGNIQPPKCRSDWLASLVSREDKTGEKPLFTKLLIV